MAEIIANLENEAFLSAVSSAKLGDFIDEKFGRLEVVKIFTEKGTYENQVKENVLYRREFPAGVLLKKEDSNVLVFVPADKL